MSEEEFFKLFVPMEARAGPTGGFKATTATPNGSAATEGNRRSAGKLQSSMKRGGQAPSTPKEGSAGPLSTTSRANGTELKAPKAKDASARGSSTPG